MGESLSADQLNKVKQILNDLVKDQLTDDNKFDVENIHDMLQTFPSSALEQALAAGTKQSYNNILDLLNRNTVNATTGTEAQKAAAAAFNTDIKDTVDLFLGLLADDRWNSTTGSPSNHPDAFGVRTVNQNLNAFEAVLCMAFGGAAGVAVSVGTGSAGHTANNNMEKRNGASQATFSTVRNETVEQGNNTEPAVNKFHIRSHEARATYLMALWAKHGMALQVFGQGAHQITVRQTADSAGGPGSCYQVYCNKVGIQEEVRTYNLWDNSESGKNHMASTIGALAATSMKDGSTGASTGKLLGGEEAFSKDILNSMCTTGSKFTMTQLGSTLRTASAVSLTMSVEKLDSAYDLGYDDVEDHLGINFKGTHITAIGDGTTANLDLSGAMDKNQDTITTPYIATILTSKHRKEFLLGMLAQADRLDVHPQAFGTAIAIAQYGAQDKELTESFGLGSETGTRQYQAVVAGFDLINEVRGYLGKPLFGGLHVPEGDRATKGPSYLAEHDVTGRAMNTSFLTNLALVNTWGVSTVGNAKKLDDDSEKTADENVLEKAIYGDYADRFKVNESGTLDGQLTSADLMANKWYEAEEREVITHIVSKILFDAFKTSPQTFNSSVLPINIGHMKQSANAYNAVTGQIQANMYAAFGETATTKKVYGRVFGGAKIESFLTSQSGFTNENAKVFFFMYSMLSGAEQQALNNIAVKHAAVAGQLTQLLKYTKATTNAIGQPVLAKLEFANATSTDNQNDYHIRNGKPTVFKKQKTTLNSTVEQQELFVPSGKLASALTAIGPAALTEAQKDVIEDRIIDAITQNLFSADPANQAKEKCRLMLVNGRQLSAAKVQSLAGDETDIKDYTAAEASVLQVSASTEMKGVVDGSDFIKYPVRKNNAVFIKAAFSAIAKATKDNSAPTRLSFYESNADDRVIITTRDDELITNIEKALEGATEEQERVFFDAVLLLSDVTASTSAEKTYVKLAKSILNLIAWELQDSATSKEHHLPGGWKLDMSGTYTGKESRAILANAMGRTQSLGAFVYDYSGLNAGITTIKPIDINGLNNEQENAQTNYNKQQAATAADKKALKLAQIATGLEPGYGAVWNNKSWGLAVFGDEIDEQPAVEAERYTNNVILYMAAFLFEDANESYRLYDTDEVCGGLGAEAVKSIIEAGDVTANDLRIVKHSVEIETEGVSKTNNKTIVEAHTFVAIDHGEISFCTGILDGVPQYEPIQTTYKVVSPPANV